MLYGLEATVMGLWRGMSKILKVALLPRKSEFFTENFTPNLKEALLPFREQAYIRKTKKLAQSTFQPTIMTGRKLAVVSLHLS